MSNQLTTYENVTIVPENGTFIPEKLENIKQFLLDIRNFSEAISDLPLWDFQKTLHEEYGFSYPDSYKIWECFHYTVGKNINENNFNSIIARAFTNPERDLSVAKDRRCYSL